MGDKFKKALNEMKVKSLPFHVKEVGQPEERTLRFIGSDETPDRDRDIISVNGWELDNYMKNPVFLWAHDYSVPPVGKAVSVFKENGKLMFDIQFPDKDVYPFADMVYNLYKGGFLNATSVGFIGKEAELREDTEVADLPEWQRGVRFMRQELLELSAVPVPSNPSALHQAKSAGVVSEEEYTSLMSFINGEYVSGSRVGVKTMKGITNVYKSLEKGGSTVTDEKEVEDKQSQTQEEGKEVEEKEKVQTQEPEEKEVCTEKEHEETQVEEKETGDYSFVINPSTKSTLLVNNATGKILGDVTDEVNHLIRGLLETAEKELVSEEKSELVLSKQNKSRLSQAKHLIIEVLEEVEIEDTQKEVDSKETNPEEKSDIVDTDGGEESVDEKDADVDYISFDFDSTEEKEDDSVLGLDEEDVEEVIKSTVASLFK